MSGSYFNPIFTNNICRDKVRVIFELGSRDLQDAYKLYTYYNSIVYAFECNPECLQECRKTLHALQNTPHQVRLIDRAVSIVDENVTFYPFDTTKYNNMGASSMLKIDFSCRDASDPDYGKPNPQTEITVKGIRLDTFMSENNMTIIDMLCIDLQGMELHALQSLGERIRNVTYIITECSIKNTYVGGATFMDVYNYLCEFGFTYVCSDKFNYDFPDVTLTGFSEFDCLFVK